MQSLTVHYNSQRHDWKTKPIDRTLAASLADRHLDMYLPDTAGLLATASSAPVLGDVKREEQEAGAGGLPSPRSLEVGDAEMEVPFDK